MVAVVCPLLPCPALYHNISSAGVQADTESGSSSLLKLFSESRRPPPQISQMCFWCLISLLPASLTLIAMPSELASGRLRTELSLHPHQWYLAQEDFQDVEMSAPRWTGHPSFPRPVLPRGTFCSHGDGLCLYCLIQ